ncbi:MAG: cation:proton antiporter [Bacteroidales bacterium]|nr:cation:proton antiporter [Candidatus Colimorpha onthohippi]
MPPIFLDLAIILVTAGVVTVIFKWLKQPLVLGYIVAGFFIGPYFPWFPAITDDTNIRVWSDIGIVFLMFALGLEFSVKSLKKVGATGAITALTELAVMFLVGSSVGKMLGFSEMECIFLGCMLSISSTTIIIKSFDDLKFKQQKFTGTVTAALVVEDIVAVLLLVLLSTLSVSKSFDGGQLVLCLVKLAFFLVVCFLFGIYLIPTFLKWMRRFMTEETLCIVAIGLCFGMVVLASYAGFSTALGAFLMGAILAETIEADAIHRIITPVKNLFGAIFFVSVGMLVDPIVLVKYIVPILVIAATVVLFKSTAATLGILLSGKPLKTAMQSGFCFCQIGEFSFIIAGLGLSFGVIGPNLYPIIVSVSIITTFVTPYMIKAGLPAYQWLYPRLPERFRSALQRYADSSSSASNEDWGRRYVKKSLINIVIYGVVLAAIVLLSSFTLRPWLLSLFAELGVADVWANVTGAVGTLLVMSPFVWALVRNRGSNTSLLKMLSGSHRSLVMVMPVVLLRYFVAIFFVGMVLARYVHLALGFVLALAVLVLIVVITSRRTTKFYNRIESRFVTNFNKRQNQNSFKIPASMEQLFCMERVNVSPYSKFIGKTLKQSGLRNNYHISLVTIERGGERITLPDGNALLMPGDRLTVIGSEEQVSHFRADAEVEPDLLVRDYPGNDVNIYRYEVKEDKPLCGCRLRDSSFRLKHNGLIIAIERKDEYIVNPDADILFEVGDIVWFVSPDDLQIDRFVQEDEDSVLLNGR